MLALRIVKWIVFHQNMFTFPERFPTTNFLCVVYRNLLPTLIFLPISSLCSNSCYDFNGTEVLQRQ